MASAGRWLSLTFDDGFRKGSEVAAEILGAHAMAATFYIVTGWVAPARAAVRERFNRGCDHGDWGHWRRIRDAGHEIGSHTFSHLNVTGSRARLFPWIVADELRRSRDDLAREVPQPSYTISMTWNASSSRSDRMVRTLYDACRLGGSSVKYNEFRALDTHRLASWAPDATASVPAYDEAIGRIPEGGWLILQFHSFDGEGWSPLSRRTFHALCEVAARHKDVKVATVAQVIERLRPSSAASSDLALRH